MSAPTAELETTRPPRALVTGASRGCGRGCAVELARAGYDVVITARTVSEGEEREHSLRVGRLDTSPLPGSLESTAAAVEAVGRTARTLAVDLGDLDALSSAITTVAEWGPFDAFVNAARYVGPGHGDRFVATPRELLEKQVAVNLLGPLEVLRGVVTQMAEVGAGVVVNLTSGAAITSPDLPVGSGGWSVGYGMTKGALHRAIEVLAVEFEESGVRFYNLEPGSVRSERLSSITDLGVRATEMLEPDDVGRVAAWLCLPRRDGHPPSGEHVQARAVLGTSI